MFGHHCTPRARHSSWNTANNLQIFAECTDLELGNTNLHLCHWPQITKVSRLAQHPKRGAEDPAVRMRVSKADAVGR